MLEHPRSVGRPLSGSIRITDEDGRELGANDIGNVWFVGGERFEYHNDPEKTSAAYDSRGWATLGDVGHVDDEGYLFLADRRTHLIISGGVNIYPQEIENLLVVHPAVADVAVVGVPHAELGEEVKAVVEPADPSAYGDRLADELIEHCRSHLAKYKCPRTVDFVDALPRTAAGKLMKRLIQDAYWTAPAEGP